MTTPIFGHGSAALGGDSGEDSLLMPTGDPTGVLDAQNLASRINNLPLVLLPDGVSTSRAGKIRLNAAQYYIASTVPVPPLVMIAGSGPATVVNFTGTGDAFSMQYPIATGGVNGVLQQTQMGGFRDFTIDGANAGNGSAGLHLDSMPLGAVVEHMLIRNFSGTGSIGLHLSNSISYTEKCRFWVHAYNCTTGMLIEKMPPPGSESFRYNDFDFFCFSFPNQNAVVVQGGAHIALSKITIRANMMSSNSAMTNALLTITGSGTDGFSEIFDCQVDIRGEIDLGLTTGKPQTIKFGSLAGGNDNVMVNCYGGMTFQNSYIASNAVAGSFTFDGPISGDATLVSVNQPTAGNPPGAASAEFTPTSPTGNSTTTLAMMGLGDSGSQASPVLYTPTNSGKVLVIITGQAQTATAAAAITLSGRVGNMPAPVNGAAAAGSVIGAALVIGPEAAAGDGVPFTLAAVLTLPAGTQKWFDVAIKTGTGGDAATITNLSIVLVELPS